jgi:hypothetical protein
MLRHKRNKHGTTHPYPQSSDAYPPLRERYTRLERKMCKDCWFSKYNRVLLHYSVSMAAAAAEAVAYFPLSAAAAAVKEERRVLRDVFNMPRM